MTPPDPQQVAEIAGRLSGAHRRLTERLTRRWIKGTGICHRSVGVDLEAQGLVESRVHHRERQIRASVTGIAVRNFIQGNHHDD